LHFRFELADLLAIDQLWVEASQGHFGFSVQRKIWEECGAPKSYDEKSWREFGNLVGWRRDNDWLGYSNLHKKLSISRAGELPVGSLISVLMPGYLSHTLPVLCHLFSRTTTCELSSTLKDERAGMYR
jgi:GUN4-like